MRNIDLNPRMMSKCMHVGFQILTTVFLCNRRFAVTSVEIVLLQGPDQKIAHEELKAWANGGFR